MVYKVIGGKGRYYNVNKGRAIGCLQLKHNNN